jgi:hypothetical protein
MAEIPDLSKMKNGNKPPEPQAVQAKTAFLVVVGTDGNIQVSADTSLDVEVQSQPTTDDIYTACALITKDIQVQQTAALVSNGLLQMGSLLQQQAQNEQIKNALRLK